MRIAEGVHRIRLGFVNAYLVEEADGLTLVDTGLDRSAKQIVRAIGAIGREPAEVQRIVLTHADLDHFGGTARMKALSGATVAVHALDAHVLEAARPRRDAALMRLMFRALRVRPLVPDMLVGEGDVLGSLRVLHTPGHSPGSITLVRDDGVVLCGDAVLSDREGRAQPPAEGRATDYEEALRSMERIMALRPKVLGVGHGEPVRLG